MKSEAEEGGESKHGESSDRWEESENEDESEDDETATEDSSTTPGRVIHHEKVHAAFHAKKQLRLDQRRRIPKSPVHDTHTEL